jgi:hypothetical protein
MHVNGKLIPVETNPGMGGGDEFKHDIFDTL